MTREELEKKVQAAQVESDHLRRVAASRRKAYEEACVQSRAARRKYLKLKLELLELKHE